MRSRRVCLVVFFFNDTATTEIYTLSLHDALPISASLSTREPCARSFSRGRSAWRSEEHTSELQSRVDISYAVFCLKKTKSLHYAGLRSIQHSGTTIQRSAVL